MGNLYRRGARRLGPLVFALLPGCMIPYAFPTVSSLAPVEVGPQTDPVHAFRVDITEQWTDDGAEARYRFATLPLTPSGRVPAQRQLSGTYGYYALGVVQQFPVYTSHTAGLRLYRPGYNLVEVDSWESPDRVTWERVADPLAQEKVLDELFLTSDLTAHEDRWPVHRRYLEPGSASAAHREALLFGASEYERLAADALLAAWHPEEIRHRLTEKAQSLRALAEK